MLNFLMCQTTTTVWEKFNSYVAAKCDFL